MTETTTLPKPAPEAPATPIRSVDRLMHLIVALLAPMFLGVSNGDLALARLAAAETVNAYGARNQADLIAVVQIIAFGMAALASLSRSMEDNISLSMTLRLRGNANALHRSAEQNRRALGTHGEATLSGTQDHEEDLSEAVLLAGLQAARKLAEDTAPPVIQPVATAPLATAAAAPIPTSTPAAADALSLPGLAAAPTAVVPSAPTTVTPRTRAWANAMLDTAAQVTAGLRDLPPAERNVASLRAAALYSTATGLLSGDIQPSLDPIMRMSPGLPSI